MAFHGKVEPPHAQQLIVTLALRRQGVVLPEIWEHFPEVCDDTVRHWVKRLVRQGILYKTERRRNRPNIFNHAGPGGFIYRADRNRAKWVVSQISLAPRP